MTDTPCIEWTRNMRNGYGRRYVKINGKPKYRSAHLLAWEEVHGPIPKGMQIDHLCRNTFCVNVDHLEMVDQAENKRRMWAARRSATCEKCGADDWRVKPGTGFRYCGSCQSVRDQLRKKK